MKLSASQNPRARSGYVSRDSIPAPRDILRSASAHVTGSAGHVVKTATPRKAWDSLPQQQQQQHGYNNNNQMASFHSNNATTTTRQQQQQQSFSSTTHNNNNNDDNSRGTGRASSSSGSGGGNRGSGSNSSSGGQQRRHHRHVQQHNIVVCGNELNVLRNRELLRSVYFGVKPRPLEVIVEASPRGQCQQRRR